MNRIVGAAFFWMSADTAVNWMEHPELSSKELSKLLSIVRSSARLTEKPSNTAKAEYLFSQRLYTHITAEELHEFYTWSLPPSPLPSRWDAWLFAEPEFSRRLAAHFSANHIAFVDLPRRDRPPTLDDEVYEESAVGLTPTDRLPAPRLMELAEQSRFVNVANSRFASSTMDWVDRQEAQYACLQVALAVQAYIRNVGEFPIDLRALVPEYLDSLPEDPYARQPMPVVYRRRSDEAVVYSRFWNEIDDGGADVTGEESRVDEALDFGIRIRTPQEPPVVAPRP